MAKGTFALPPKPMLAFAAVPFDSPDFIFELKFDGTRAFLYFSRGKVTLINRRQINITYRYPELTKLEAQINAQEAILDGEIVVLKGGKPHFPSLQQREHVEDPLKIEILSVQMPATYVAFDVLYKDGKDLTSLPLIERKNILNEVVREGNQIILSDYVENFGVSYFNSASKFGLEGIMAKRKNSKYELGKRSKNWLKIKATETFDCVVCGYTAGKGRRAATLGALVLGMYYKGKLAYVGRVGTGWSEKTLEEIYSLLRKIPGKKLFSVEKGIKVCWVRPKLVAVIEAMGLTDDKKLRAPSFRRLREDKVPKECKLEEYL